MIVPFPSGSYSSAFIFQISQCVRGCVMPRRLRGTVQTAPESPSHMQLRNFVLTACTIRMCSSHICSPYTQPSATNVIVALEHFLPCLNVYAPLACS
jgi:hypothetical protein